MTITLATQTLTPSFSLPFNGLTAVKSILPENCASIGNTESIEDIKPTLGRQDHPAGRQSAGYNYWQHN